MAGIIFIAVLAVAAISISIFVHSGLWPFGQEQVTRDLQQASDSQVSIRAFHPFYFPHPGCKLEGVVFRHGQSAKPLISVEKLTIRSSYFTILAHRVSLIQAEGLKIFIPEFGTGQAFHTSNSNVSINEFIADDATVEFGSRNLAKSPARFDIRHALLRDVGSSDPVRYQINLHIPEPPGDIQASGKFGPWVYADAKQTALSGEYQFEHGDLGVFGGIAGIVSSAGKFSGALGHIDISGTTETPDFEVKSGGHPVRLSTKFSAYVDATHGDTYLNHVDAQFRKTHVVAEGSIAKSKTGPGKTALIHLSTEGGRIDDVLGLFTKEKAPMSGPVTLHADVEIPHGQEPFLEKVKLRGHFGIGQGEFTKPSTQQEVDRLSAGARGEKNKADAENVLTDLKGEVSLIHTVATFSDLSFGIPGAAARMHGTYNVENHRVDLHGQLHVDTKISKTTSGGKAFLLKLMDPFFKKRKKGEDLPVKLSGTYEKPAWGLDVMDPKAQVPPATPR